MKKVSLPTDYVAVLKQVSEIGEEDFDFLAESMPFSIDRLAHIVQELHHRGLIISRRTYYGIWISLSAKGKKRARALRTKPLAV